MERHDTLEGWKSTFLTQPPLKDDRYVSSLRSLKQVAQELREDSVCIAETISNWKKDSLVLNHLCEKLQDAVIRVNSEGYIFEFNDAACNLFKTSASYMLGKNISVILYTDWDIYVSHFDLDTSFEHMAHAIDSSSLLVSTSLTKIDSSEYILVIRDISQRVKSEQDIRILSTALNQASDVIVITNSANKIIFVNEAFISHTGYSKEEAIGKDPGFLKSNLTEPSVYAEMWKALKQHRSWEGYLLNKKKNGTLVKDYMLVTSVMNGDPVIPAFYISVKRVDKSEAV